MPVVRGEDLPVTRFADLGISLVEVWAVKNMMLNGGYALKYPAPEESRAHWKVVAPGS